MSIGPSARTLKLQQSPVAKLPLPTPDLTPDDRVSNFEAPPSEASEGDMDDLLARLGKRFAYVDPDARFAQWYVGEYSLCAASDEGLTCRRE